LLATIVDAEWVGHLLYEFDHMADVATDFLAAKISDAENQALAGSFTMLERADSGRPPNSYVAVFLTKDRPARIAFRVHIAAGVESVLEKVSPPVPAGDALLFQFRARETALAAIPKWNGPMKAVVLPGSIVGRPASLAVYLIRRERHARELAAGMHYRVFVSEDGATLQRVDPLSDVAGLNQLGPNSPAISNFRLGHPSEVDVFLSWAHRDVRIIVVTARVIWFIFRGEVGAGRQPPDPELLKAIREALVTRAAENGMPATELPTEYL
jgi:hypothetical protein